MHICPDELMLLAMAIPFVGVYIKKIINKFRSFSAYGWLKESNKDNK